MAGTAPQFILNTERVDDPLVSVVVPVFDEQESLRHFHDAIATVSTRESIRVEFVFVNDGSTDDTLHRLFSLQRADPRVRIINLSRNFGKEAALTAGLAESRGDVVVPIDVDLQDPPDLLIPFLEKWREGYDVVYGIRRDRTQDGRAKRVSAGAFYRIFNALTSTPIPPNVGDFRLLDRRVVDAILSLGERTRFMKGLFAWVGYPSVGVEFDRPERSGGRSAWTPWRLWNFALDGITSFSTVPLRMWTYVGLSIAAASSLYAVTVFALTLFGIANEVPGYLSQLLVILFLGAFQLISLGLIGEYLARVVTETKQRPVYIIEGSYDAAPHGRSDEPSSWT